MKFKRSPLILMVLIVLVSLLLIAADVIDESRIEEIIAGIIGFAIMLFGPKPLKKLYDLFKIPGGAWRVFATYALSGVVGLIVMLAAGVFFDVVWNVETILALAGALAMAAQLSYHRLKDLREI